MRLRQYQRYFIAAAVCFLVICALKIPTMLHPPSDIEFTAHRGCSCSYPENTIISFRAAANLGVDCIELDVQQTKDGVPVISHDQNLSRTTGVNRKISSLNYRQLEKLDAGSWCSLQFAGEQIPSLEKVLKLAQYSQIRLNMELKPASYDTKLGKKIIRLIRRYHMQNRCVVASQDYGILYEIKQYAPEITTLYIVRDAGEDFASLDCADEISIDYQMLTAGAVARIHACGKRVHVWTVDTVEEIRIAAALHADDIITDNPSLIQVAFPRK